VEKTGGGEGGMGGVLKIERLRASEDFLERLGPLRTVAKPGGNQ